MEASLEAPSSFSNQEITSLEDNLSFKKKIKKDKLLEKKLKEIEILAKEAVAKTGSVDFAKLEIEKQSCFVKNCCGRWVIKLLPWCVVVSGIIDLLSRVSEYVALQYSWECELPYWGLATGIGVTVVAGVTAIAETQLSRVAEKYAAKAEKLNEELKQEFYFKLFIASFAKYKEQVDQLVDLVKELSKKDENSKPTTTILLDQDQQYVNDQQNSTEEQSEEKSESSETAKSQKILSLEDTLEILKNKLTPEQQNTVMSHELWASAHIYLSNKEAEALKALKELGMEYQQPKEYAKLRKLAKSASKTATLMQQNPSENYSGGLSRSEQKSLKHFEGEQASFELESFSDDTSKYFNGKLNEFYNYWKKIEKRCGQLNYLAINGVFIGSNGKIYQTEEEASQGCKIQEKEEDKDEVVINLSHNENDQEWEKEDIV